MQIPPRHLALNRAALVVIDVQRGFDDTVYWGRRDNPACESNIAALLVQWRELGWPVVFVRHDSTSDASPLRPGQAGNDLKPEVTGIPDLLVTKSVNSSFHGTPDLDAWLRANGIEQIVVTGISTNHCCETTARVGGNLGYDVYFALDATHSFDRTAPDGTVIPAATLAAVTATNLDREFAVVCSTADILR
ncbi:cysteine hydrolase family protein [Microbacterium sp. 179-I 1D1 NHS]|uniref:cysteine hydrolase family protein n=1 Tax=Microbacterium sp. 179-I 1D1 NHS TaxID=3374298 RepID=UPI00387A7039